MTQERADDLLPEEFLMAYIRKTCSGAIAVMGDKDIRAHFEQYFPTDFSSVIKSATDLYIVAMNTRSKGTQEGDQKEGEVIDHAIGTIKYLAQFLTKEELSAAIELGEVHNPDDVIYNLRSLKQ